MSTHTLTRLQSRRVACNKYEKSRKGFLMRLYRNMQSRIEGVQKTKIHLYDGKSLLPRQEFYDWALASERFRELFGVYEASGFDRKLAPSADRIESERGYEITNMEWTTHSENSRRGCVNRWGERFDADTISRMREMLANGLSQRAVGRSIGCSHSTVRRVLG